MTYSFTVAAQNCLGLGPPTAQSSRIVATGPQLNEDGFKIEGMRLNDRMTLHVNTFNGNVNLHENDLRVKGTGLNLGIDRYYNNLAGNQVSIFGNNWTTTVGSDIKLAFLGNGSLMFNGPGGYQLGFAQNTDGTYASPAGIDADMKKNGDGTYTLTFHASSEKYNFSCIGAWTSDVDRNANTIRFTYSGPGGRLSSLNDTQNRVVTFAYNAQNLVSAITDSSGRQYQYSYTGNNLTGYVDPLAGTTLFQYDAGNNLTQVTTPGGRVTTLGYDPGQRVTSIGHPLAWGNRTMSFAYTAWTNWSPAITAVTDANANTTTCTDNDPGRARPQGHRRRWQQYSAGYTSNSNVQQFQTGGGAGASYGYDSVNNLTSAAGYTGAQSQGHIRRQHPPYQPTGLTDPQGNTLNLAYDLNGNLRDRDRPAQQPEPGSGRLQRQGRALVEHRSRREPDHLRVRQPRKPDLDDATRSARSDPDLLRRPEPGHRGRGRQGSVHELRLRRPRPCHDGQPCRWSRAPRNLRRRWQPGPDGRRHRYDDDDLRRSQPPGPANDAGRRRPVA